MQQVDADFAVSDYGDEIKITLLSSDGSKLEPQTVLDAVVELIMYRYGVMPSITPKTLDS